VFGKHNLHSNKRGKRSFFKKETKKANRMEKIFNILLSDRTKEASEKVILTIAIISFIVHLIIILLVHLNLIHIESNLISSPIAAIYTPFSFILVYEVYLLIYYLPRSITIYVGKQYEIITLIIIRRLFKDLANLNLSSAWFETKSDLQFTYDVFASIILFYFISVFYKSIKKRETPVAGVQENLQENIKYFVLIKKGIAALLVPVLLMIAISSFYMWSVSELSFKNINSVFFDEFFTILIIADVMLLLTSFFYSDKFHKIMRNSGFVISTILIRLSFSVDGLVNTVLIIGAVSFGLLMNLIHNQYEKNAQDQKF
jgi:hypothetical protein